MDWDKVLTLLQIATEANDFPKLHKIRDSALGELETMMTEESPAEEEEEE